MHPALRLKWPFTEWETGPEQKSRKNGKENGKWPQARNGRKMAPKMGFWPAFGHFFHFGGHFSAISGVGPFSIFFPIFPGFLLWARFPFCRWPLQSQTQPAHCRRKAFIDQEPPTPGIFSKVLPVQWEASHGTNWRCTAAFPFVQGLEARKAQRYKWGSCRGRDFRNQEKGVIAKGVSAESSVTPKETKNVQGCWTAKRDAHSAKTPF